MLMQEAIQSRIVGVLESVRGYLQQDGGDVEFVDFDRESGIARVRLTGACKTCPMSMMTLRAGIERMVKKHIPEIVRIEATE